MHLYEEVNAPMPRECPFNPQRSIYGLHEDHKLIDGPTRYTCNYCGKAFYDERFLDIHFENRHSEFIRTGSDSVCLDDHCDMFRCDVEIGITKAKYWDKLLCKESQLYQMQEVCNDTFALCVPKFLHGEERELFLAKIQGAICGFLTCAKYWDARHETSHPLTIAAYIFLVMFIAVSLIIYYYITCTHFFSDDSIIDQYNEEDHHPSRYRHGDREIRHRKAKFVS